MGLDRAAVDAQRQQQVLEQDLSRLQIDRAGAIVAGLDRWEAEPRTRGVLRTELEFERAGARTGEAQVNVFEPGLLAIAAVVDHQVSALEADFRQVAAVEAEGAEAVHPGEESSKILLQASASLSRTVAVRNPSFHLRRRTSHVPPPSPRR